MVKLRVVKPFRDMKENIRRPIGEEFEATKDRAVELSDLKLVEILEIENPEVIQKPVKRGSKSTKKAKKGNVKAKKK